MAVKISLLAPCIGAEAEGADLSKPISDSDFKAIRDAFYAHSLLIIRGHVFDDDDHIRFSSRFGKLKLLKFNDFIVKKRPEIFIISNVKEEGRYIGSHDAGMFWHSDGPFLEHPHGPSALHALEVPVDNGRALGDTHFTSTAAAYEALPKHTKERIAGLKAVNSIMRRYAKAQDEGVKDSSTLNQSATQETEAVHSVVRVHPITGRKCLYVSEGYTTKLLGLPETESRELISELTTHIIKPEFRYVHSWRAHDLVMWDNCATQHKATFDYKLPQRRVMHRTTLLEGT